MPRPAYTGEQIRQAEAPLLEAGEGDRLMRRAAGQLAAVCRRVLRLGGGTVYGRRAAVLTGPGNNGGDALFAAADLARRGVAVTLLHTLGTPHREGLAAALSAGCRQAEIAEAPGHLGAADLVVDGIFGTGAKPQLPEDIVQLLCVWQASSARAEGQITVAVDVPTGIDASTGRSAQAAVQADWTVTFGGLKTGLFTGAGASAAGRVVLAPIGLDFSDTVPDAWVYRRDDLRELVKAPTGEDHKYTRGVAGICAGSADYPGAAVLCTSAAVAAGAGMVRITGDAQLRSAVAAEVPEAVAADGRVQVWAVGPGSPSSDRTEAVFASGEPVIADAGALDHLPEHLPTGSIITPHAGELERLLTARGHSVQRAQIEQDQLHWARAAAEELDAVVLLKGHRSVIAEPDGTVHLPQAGSANLATAGSGDVLTGVLAAFLAERAAAKGRLDPGTTAVTAAAAVLLHGRAGKTAVHASGLPQAVEQAVLKARGR
ncbi:bifunctional ADP-dependent NAD(P)H-hydrate dehydratase/NAD(P)H-hydrate epimerase [Brevibacterium sp. HMSC07C04]|uniref:bifunctional ADP-dependent NAD(P)H-hydrate dehydratase/NAD(P)H-hydrate epimerase n=1 Tax=Brevibacterium sp. HMSC07C04 TaxID=1581130 RepID=UPI0008A4A614|nr:bifunctional ADP-dependent NAD(P)H-hydrate dehydratase/NAD(P)H-hydrate epimerase [Brevibacterium sp. HMSC07C04]OFS26842.1 hypothetical protein HMPREF3162_04010 [Brevibacterium sp. HMSC07C04]